MPSKKTAPIGFTFLSNKQECLGECDIARCDFMRKYKNPLMTPVMLEKSARRSLKVAGIISSL